MKGNQHDASDERLDREAFSADADQQQGRQGHDPEKISRHDDTGKDRLFEGRQQHDEAELNSEKTRLARDVERHHHAVDEHVADNGTSHNAKRKS